LAEDTPIPDGDVVMGFLDCFGDTLVGDAWFVTDDGVVECFSNTNPLSLTGLLDADGRGDRVVYPSVQAVRDELFSLLPS